MRSDDKSWKTQTDKGFRGFITCKYSRNNVRCVSGNSRYFCSWLFVRVKPAFKREKPPGPEQPPPSGCFSASVKVPMMPPHSKSWALISAAPDRPSSFVSSSPSSSVKGVTSVRWSDRLASFSPCALCSGRSIIPTLPQRVRSLYRPPS